MKLNGIIETVIYADDLSLMKRFYEEVLKLESYAYKEESFLFFKIGNSMLLFFNPLESRHNKDLPPHFAEGQQHFAFEVDEEEYEAWKAQVAEIVEIEHEHKWPNGKLSFYFRDPENNSVEIVMKSIWEKF